MSERRRMGARQQRGGVGLRRPDGKATVLEKASGAVDVPAAVACVRRRGKKMLICFFIFYFGEIMSY